MTHTNANIDCDQFADALSDLLERDVDDTARARLEGHALSCAECGALLADLRKLRIDAANLPALEPSRDLWSGIATRIETPVVEITPGRGAVAHNGGTVERFSGGAAERSSGGTVKRRHLAPMWMGLAAAGLVAITAGVTYQLTKSTIDVRSPSVAVAMQTVGLTTPSAASNAPAQALNRSTVPPDSLNRSTASPGLALASVKPTAEQTYDLEIRRLNAILVARRGQLDTTTVAVVEKNLRVIDDAIAQCKAALQRDPASRFLIESLNDALDTKVQLLRTAAQLPTRS